MQEPGVQLLLLLETLPGLCTVLQSQPRLQILQQPHQARVTPLDAVLLSRSKACMASMQRSECIQCRHLSDPLPYPALRSCPVP